MNVFAQALISGLVIGSIYAVMTIGLTLVYGCLRTLNMAQGSFGMVGGTLPWATPISTPMTGLSSSALRLI